MCNLTSAAAHDLGGGGCSRDGDDARLALQSLPLRAYPHWIAYSIAKNPHTLSLLRAYPHQSTAVIETQWDKLEFNSPRPNPTSIDRVRSKEKRLLYLLSARENGSTRKSANSFTNTQNHIGIPCPFWLKSFGQSR